MKQKFYIKVIVILIIYIFIVVWIYGITYNFYLAKKEINELGEESLNTLHSINNSIESMLDKIDEYSKLMISDASVQKMMNYKEFDSNIELETETMNTFYSFLQFTEEIDSIWLLNQSGDALRVGNAFNVSRKIDEASVEDIKEYSMLRGRARLVFTPINGQNIPSLIRAYMNLDTFESRGLLGINIKKDYLQNVTRDVIDSQEQIVFLDYESRIIYNSNNLRKESDFWFDCYQMKNEQDELKQVIQIDNNRYLVTGIKDKDTGISIIRYSPIKKDKMSIKRTFENLPQLLLVIIVAVSGAAIISFMLSRPINYISICMKGKEDGKPVKASQNPILKEMQVLFSDYNKMVDQIEYLMQETVDKQKRIRQVELNEIQEQMKPHFLYNTLDAIQALSLLGESDKVCQLIEALGDFYRKSVSGGKEFLTIKEECEMAKSYASIMRIRFDNTFDFEINCDQESEKYYIPKLTLQPLVENAFQHGIKNKGTYGSIDVDIFREKNNINIIIEDSGKGVPDSVIEEIMQENSLERGKSLGLRGTIERLKLVYGSGFEFAIINDGRSCIHFKIAIDKLIELEKGRNVSVS